MKTKPLHKKCENCGESLTGIFCAHCGQKDHDEEFKVSSTLKEWLIEHFDVDGTVFRSLKELVFHPGKISRRFAQGQRVGMVRPISMLLSLTVLMVLFDQVFPVSTNMIKDNIASKVIPKLDSKESITFFELVTLIDKKSGVYSKAECEAGLKKTIASIDEILGPKLIGQYVELGKIESKEKGQAILSSTKSVLKNSCSLQDFLDEYSLYVYWATIPFIALISLLFFRKYESRYVMHLIFYVHINAFGVVFTLVSNMFGLVLFKFVTLPPFAWGSFYTLTPLVYTAMASKCFVDRPWKEVWWRVLLSLITFLIFIYGGTILLVGALKKLGYL